MSVSNNPTITLSTYALGSCVAVVVYDPVVKAGGMLHAMLPDSRLSPTKARDHPAMFVSLYPGLDTLNLMRLHSPESAILSAVIFNALIIVALVPLALRGVRYVPVGAAALLRRNLLAYGLGGIAAPFLGIKIIDVILQLLGLA